MKAIHNKREKKKTKHDLEVIESINRAHAMFWKLRGYSPPPRVSTKRLGCFDLPSGELI